MKSGGLHLLVLTLGLEFPAQVNPDLPWFKHMVMNILNTLSRFTGQARSVKVIHIVIVGIKQV
jgi:hypothetical protein